MITFILPGLWSNPIFASDSLTVATWNIRYDNPKDGKNKWAKRTDLVVEVIMEESPDILGIQEGLKNQVDYLKENLDGYSFKGYGRDDGAEQGEICGFFYKSSKLKVLEAEMKWLSETPEIPSIGWDAALERIVVWGQFEIIDNGRIVNVFCTHFDHRGPVARLKSAEFISNLSYMIGMTGYPTIILGDLNDTPDSNPIMTLDNVFQDCATAAEKISGPKGTFHGFDSEHPLDARIDYIFTSHADVRKYKVRDRETKAPYSSDHLYVSAVLELRSERGY
jgi:endonuclease/exonuclease/phosphatase family metal-dependent hydrolase